jgi:glucosamine--fructose-6-phosphate aminotransferase (isomerizing)
VAAGSGTYLKNVLAQPQTLRDAAAAYARPEFSQALDRAASLLRRGALTSTGMGASFFALHGTRGSLDAAVRSHWIDETGFLAEQASALRRPMDALLLVSQSGETVEGRQLLPQLPEVPSVLITRDPSSSLAAAADVVLSLHSPPDRSVAIQTYVTSLAVLELLALRIRGLDTAEFLDDLRACADSAELLLESLTAQLPVIVERLFAAGQIYAIGRGNAVGSALGTALLFKESAKRDCEASSAAQFRHGAVEVVASDTAAIVYGSADPEQQLLDYRLVIELVSSRASVLVLCGDGFPDVPGASFLRLPGAPAATGAILEIIPAQLIAHALAESNGVTAGDFRNTVPVIVTA